MASPLQRKLKITGPTVVTANRLRDGVVVWLQAGGIWGENLAQAAVGTTSDEVLDLLDIANADESIAVGAYAARINLGEDGLPVPGNLRERIRCAGPTVAYGETAGAH